MRRSSPAEQLLLGVGAQVLSVFLQGRVEFGNEPFANPTDPLAHTLPLAVVVAASGVAGWSVLRATRRSAVVGAVFFVIGSAAALWWPIGFFLGVETPDPVAEWAYAPALPVWQGLVLIALGVYSIGAARGVRLPGADRPAGRAALTPPDGAVR